MVSDKLCKAKTEPTDAVSTLIGPIFMLKKYLGEIYMSLANIYRTVAFIAGAVLLVTTGFVDTDYSSPVIIMEGLLLGGTSLTLISSPKTGVKITGIVLTVLFGLLVFLGIALLYASVQ